MSNAIQTALNQIKFAIPMQILQRAFIDQSYFSHNPYSIDDNILTNVIRSKVMQDCNLLGGTTIVIDVAQCSTRTVDSMTKVITVPKSVTAGRSIVSVINVSYVTAGLLAALSAGGPGFTNTNVSSSSCCGANSNSPIQNALTNLYNVGNSLPVISTAIAEIIGENVVLVKNLPISIGMGLGLICVVANDENMSNLQPRSIYDFSKLCVLATKAYIYNKLIIEIDIGQYKAGASLGVIRNIIEEYKDAHEQYNDFLTTVWTKVAYTNDKMKYNRLLMRTTGQRP